MREKYIIYGAGKEGRRVIGVLGKNKVEAFCDKDANKLVEIDGVPVITPSELVIKKNHIVVIAIKSLSANIEVSRWLRDNKIPYIFAKELLDSKIRSMIEDYSSLNVRDTFSYNKEYEYIISDDIGADAGEYGSYFYQDLWAAKHIYTSKPMVHYDIGSRIDGFIAHILAFGQKVKQIDIRPIESNIDGWEFIQEDATYLKSIADNSLESLSALCSLEHFGLGRYGDEIDPEACFKCFKAIQRKIKRGGKLYISVPIGKEHLEFNAHRIFDPKTIIHEFGDMTLMEFSTANGKFFIQNDSISKYHDYINRRGHLFGLFMFEKK